MVPSMILSEHGITMLDIPDRSPSDPRGAEPGFKHTVPTLLTIAESCLGRLSVLNDVFIEQDTTIAGQGTGAPEQNL